MYTDTAKLLRARQLTNRADPELRTYIADLERVVKASVDLFQKDSCDEDTHDQCTDCAYSRHVEALFDTGFVD